MTEEMLRDAKIIRRNAKAALTRASKSLRHLIQSKRPGKEVSDVLFKVQKAYETLIDKHEEFTKLIEDDKEFEEQEARLEESQYMFMSLETDTKLYLESTKEVQKEFKGKESQPSNNEVSYENTSSSGITKSSISSSDNADNVASINLVTEESNVVNNASLVNEVDKRVGKRVVSKWRSPKCLNFLGMLESTQYSVRILNTQSRPGTASGMLSPFYAPAYRGNCLSS